MFPYLRTVEEFLNDCESIEYKVVYTKANREMYELVPIGNDEKTVCPYMKEPTMNYENATCTECKCISRLIYWMINRVGEVDWHDDVSNGIKKTSFSEIKAWCVSVTHFMYELLKDNDFYNLMIGMECFMDNTSEEGNHVRADIVLGGYGRHGQRNILVIELKQHNEKNRGNVLKATLEAAKKQAEFYCKEMEWQIREENRKETIDFIGCVYMHNLDSQSPKAKEVFATTCASTNNCYFKNETDYFRRWLKDAIFYDSCNDNKNIDDSKLLFKELKKRSKCFTLKELAEIIDSDKCDENRIHEVYEKALRPDQRNVYRNAKKYLLFAKLSTMKKEKLADLLVHAFKERSHEPGIVPLSGVDGRIIKELDSSSMTSYEKECGTIRRSIYKILSENAEIKGRVNSVDWDIIKDHYDKEWKGKKESPYLNIFVNDFKKIVVEKKKPQLFVEGTPGSGKTLINMLLVRFCLDIGMDVVYCFGGNAAKTAIWEMVDKKIWRSDLRGNQVDNKRVFVRHWTILDDLKEKKDKLANRVFLFDEAHRYGNNRNYKVPELIEQLNNISNTWLASIYYYDPKQFITKADQDGMNAIKQFENDILNGSYPNSFGKKVYLWSQFRCNSDEGYVTWVEQVLGIKPNNFTLQPGSSNSNDTVYIDDIDYEVEVIPDKFELNNKIRELKKEENANYILAINEIACRRYISLILDGDNKDVSIVNTINIQGIEYDNVIVIVGNDFSKNCDIIVKNQYRVLLTRGLKKCYIFCIDPETSKYFSSRIKRNYP